MRLSVTALVLSLYWVTPAACVPIPEGAQTASTNATPQVKPTVRELAMKWAYTKAMNGVDYFRAVPNVVDQQLDATQLEFWNKIAVMSEKNGLQIMKKYPEKDGVSFISSLQTAKTNYNTKKDIEELNSMLRYTIKGLPKEAQKELVQDIQRVIDATEGTESHWDRRRWHTAERQSSPVKRAGEAGKLLDDFLAFIEELLEKIKKMGKSFKSVSKPASPFEKEGIEHYGFVRV